MLFRSLFSHLLIVVLILAVIGLSVLIRFPVIAVFLTFEAPVSDVKLLFHFAGWLLHF